MTAPAHLSDRMPDVALGRDVWDAGDLAHLTSCPDCAAEWRVVQAGSRLGREVERALDLPALVEGVTRRLRAEPRRVQRRLQPRWVLYAALAAAAVLFLALVLRPPPGGPGDGTSAPPAAAQALLPELEGLQPEELETLLNLLPASTPALPGLPGLDDLSPRELEQVLRTLEG